MKSVDYFKEGKGTIPILLHVVVLWSRSKNFHSEIRSELNYTIEDQAQLFIQEEYDLGKGPELVGYWSQTDASLNNSVWEDENGSTIFYPGVLFIGKTAPIIQ